MVSVYFPLLYFTFLREKNSFFISFNSFNGFVSFFICTFVFAHNVYLCMSAPVCLSVCVFVRVWQCRPYLSEKINQERFPVPPPSSTPDEGPLETINVREEKDFFQSENKFFANYHRNRRNRNRHRNRPSPFRFR